MNEDRYRTRDQIMRLLREAREQADMTEGDVVELVRRERGVNLTVEQVHEAENPHRTWPGRIDDLRAVIASVLLGGEWRALTVFEQDARDIPS